MVKAFDCGLACAQLVRFERCPEEANLLEVWKDGIHEAVFEGGVFDFWSIDHEVVNEGQLDVHEVKCLELLGESLYDWFEFLHLNVFYI